MASYAGGCIVNRNNYSTERQEKDPKSKQNEILLYRNNALVVKAERGVTLGLIKLIYSSDENNSGLLLGVRPRLSTGQVPCLITFDSTTLQLDAYDLIVHDSGSASPSEQAAQPSNTTTEQPQSSSTNQILEKNTPTQSTTNQEWSNQEPDTSANTIQDDFHSNVDESLRDVAALIPDTSKPDEVRPTVSFRDDTNADNTEPDSTEMMEKFPFEPEQFDFDIKSITPVQTDAGLRWPCDRCGKDYCSASHLKRHWILHTDFRPYKCTLCDKKFPFHWDLKRHMTKHTGNKRFKCPNCDKSFNTQKELKCHSWLHTGQKLYKCQVCNHELSSSGNLKVHMRKHTGVKPYKCEFCPRSFYMMGHYQYHKMRHTGIKPYKCDICGKTFSFSLNLREHNNIHTGAKPYSCPKCDKKFAHRSTLKQHILVHGGERPYKCHICSKDFVQSSNYRMHLLTHQDKELRIQKCDLCGKELLSRRWVSKHRQRCLKKLMEGKDGKTKKPREPRQEYTCEVCSRVFKYRANFDTHCKKAHVPGAEEKKKPTTTKKIARNKVSCPICQKKFLYISCVKKHLQKRHAGVEMAVPENMQSASNLKDSSFAITSGEDSRVVIRSSASKTDEPSPESTSVSSASKVEVIPIVQPVPTIHIQPTGNPSSKSVTFIFVPSTTSNPKPVKPDKAPKAVKQSTVTSDSRASYTLTRSDEVSKEKAPETGSQAISALKKLSAKVGIQDPNGSEEHRKTIQSKHLSALEQLNKRVGDYGSVALETVHPAPPRDHVPSQEHLASRDSHAKLSNVAEAVTSEKVDERREVTSTGVSRSIQRSQVGGNARGIET